MTIVCNRPLAFQAKSLAAANILVQQVISATVSELVGLRDLMVGATAHAPNPPQRCGTCKRADF